MYKLKNLTPSGDPIATFSSEVVEDKLSVKIVPAAAAPMLQ